MKKIDINTGLCDHWELDQAAFQKAISKGADITEGCATCRYILFAYCHYEDREDPVVTRALEGNYDSKKMIHNKIQTLEAEG